MSPNGIWQGLSLLGAVLVLSGFVGLQRGAFDRTDRLFLAVNAVGGFLLFLVAVKDRRLGFMLLEGVWTLTALVPLLVRRRGSG